MKVVLEVIAGSGTGRSIEFSEPRGFLLGRAKDADFQIPDDPYVSRRHVYLEIAPPVCRLTDLTAAGETARNAPHVNGQPVTRTELKEGDVIELGFTRLRVKIALEVQARAGRCRGCGQPLELLPNEAEPASCPACPKRKESAAPRPAVAARCRTCQTDLSALADSDGRAQALAGVAVYCCEKCLPAADRHAGASIGGYEVRRMLGEGGMGSVFLVYQRSTGRLFTLKQMKSLKDPLLVKRFQREIHLLGSLAHGNVVGYVDTGVHQGAPYLVAEYVPDGDLEGLLASAGGVLPPRQAILLMRDVLAGVEYLHGRKVIHRDIKPPNILLRRDGALVKPKLADFGLAKAYAEAGGAALTSPGTGMGTLMFMPPEQIRDVAKAREPADLYSAGVTLYYLLTGKYPFDFPTPSDVLRFARDNPGKARSPEGFLQALAALRRLQHPYMIILSEEPIPVGKRNPALPARLTEVVDRAVRKDPAKRFQSAAEFRRKLPDP